jgi:RNA polymerase sigma factor (sigma-70 family)
MRSELMQEALKAHEAAKTARDPAAYVSRSLYNRAFHLYRAGKRQRDFENEAAAFSLDAPGSQGRDGQTPLVECIADENQLDLAEALELKIRREVVLDALSVSPRLQHFTALYMDGLSQADLARYFGISHERARQMLAQAVKTARKQLGIDFEGRPVYRKPRKQHLPL